LIGQKAKFIKGYIPSFSRNSSNNSSQTFIGGSEHKGHSKKLDDSKSPLIPYGNKVDFKFNQSK